MAQCYLVDETDHRYVAGDGREGAGGTEEAMAAVPLKDYGGKINCDEDVSQDSEVAEEADRSLYDVGDATIQRQKILCYEGVQSDQCQ